MSEMIHGYHNLDTIAFQHSEYRTMNNVYGTHLCFLLIMYAPLMVDANMNMIY